MIRQHLRQKLPSQVQFIGMEQNRLHQETLSDSCPTFVISYSGYSVLCHMRSLCHRALNSVTFSLLSEEVLHFKRTKHCVPYLYKFGSI